MTTTRASLKYIGDKQLNQITPLSIREGKPYRNVRRSFDNALKKAQIEDFTFHDLRHTFASYMVMSGLDINTLREILGHSSITMTQRYAHLAPSFKQKAMQNIVTILSQNKESEKASSLNY